MRGAERGITLCKTCSIIRLRVIAQYLIEGLFGICTLWTRLFAIDGLHTRVLECDWLGRGSQDKGEFDNDKDETIGSKVLIEVQAAENLRNLRKANKTCSDHHKPFRSEAQQLHVGDLVLVHRTKYSTSRSRVRKLDDRWSGPYRIREIPDNPTFYRR